jgi:hypothetical protein
MTYIFTHTVHADQIPNITNDFNLQTEFIDQLETEQCSQTIDDEQNDIHKKPFSKQNLVGIALLLSFHGYAISMPFIPEQYIVHGKWSFSLPLTLIIGALLLSDRMSDIVTDMSSYESSDSTQSDYSMHNSNLPYSLMYPSTPTYTPTFIPIHF